MRQFIFQGLGNTVALILTFLVMPGLAFENAMPLVNFLGLEAYVTDVNSSRFLHFTLLLILVLLLGFFYTVIDRYIKPLLRALTGRFVVWSLGISVVVVNIIVFWMFIAFSPVNWYLTNPVWVRIVIGGVLLSLFGTAIEVIFGINQPRVLKVDPDKRYWRFIESLPLVRDSTMVESIRINQIWDKLFGFATDVLVGKGVISGIREAVYRLMYGEPNPMADAFRSGKIAYPHGEPGPHMGQVRTNGRKPGGQPARRVGRATDSAAEQR